MRTEPIFDVSNLVKDYCVRRRPLQRGISTRSIGEIKLDEQGKSLPTGPAETRTFTALEPARTFAAEHKAEFDRIVPIKTSGEAQQLVERFRDGELQR